LKAQDNYIKIKDHEKTLSEEKNRIVKLMEQPEQINELGFDAPAIVDDEILKILVPLVKSPEFLDKVMTHAGFSKDSRFAPRTARIIDGRLKRIIRAIKEIPNTFSNVELDLDDEDEI